MGDPETGVELCNGEGCFGTAEAERWFDSRLSLARFFLRSANTETEWTLVADELAGSEDVALRTFASVSGLRLHSLDENIYLDPAGYWVRAGDRAEFVIEGDCRGTCLLTVANGGQENRVEITYRETIHNFSLGPWERRRVEVTADDDMLGLSVMSASGFRPSEIDPSTDDSRFLGVLVTLSKANQKD